MSESIIAIAGSSGDLGTRIAAELSTLGVQTRLLVRKASHRPLNPRSTEKIVDYADADALARALEGSSCVVSALAGLREVIIDKQTELLRAAERAGVPRFIPSDYAIDYTRIPPGSNRNLELRREFRGIVDAASVRATSILNGAFMDMLSGTMPLIQTGLRRILFWGDANQKLDFTTIADTARFTARAALDDEAPRDLYIAGDEVSPRDLMETMSDLSGRRYGLLRPGGLGQLRVLIGVTRFFVPGREALYPPWQGMQYFHNMLSGAPKFERLDNGRYEDMQFETTRSLLERVATGRPTVR